MEKYNVLSIIERNYKTSEQMIEDLVKEGKIGKAQNLYFTNQIEKRKGIIRL